MKKILFIAMLFFFAFESKAQELNFDETVKYIKDRLIGVTSEYDWDYPDLEKGIGHYLSSHIKEVNISSKGDITVVVYYEFAPQFKFNLFKISSKTEGISQGGNTVFFDDNKQQIGLINAPSTVDAERLYKAFIHLRSLCTKEKDPFDD